MAPYNRVFSASDQDNGRQERALRAYSDRSGYRVVAVFRETPSGIRKAKGAQRAGRQLAMAQTREVDAVGPLAS